MQSERMKEVFRRAEKVRSSLKQWKQRRTPDVYIVERYCGKLERNTTFKIFESDYAEHDP